MIAYLGKRLARTHDGHISVRYLSKAEGEAVWKAGFLLSIDPQGACFVTQDGDVDIAECLPWGSIGAIRALAPNLEGVASNGAAREKRRSAPTRS